MAKPTLQDLADRALRAIERRETFVYDIASEFCQILGNVRHMRWFRLAVMRQLAQDTVKYSHLLGAIPEQ